MSKSGSVKETDDIKDVSSSNVHSRDKLTTKKPNQHGYYLRPRTKRVEDEMRLSQEISYDYSGLH